MLTRILCGARSGMGAQVEVLTDASGKSVRHVATATAGDAEMRAPVAPHRAYRSSDWRIVEAGRDVAAALRAWPTGCC